jgi:carbonic anhydrase
MHEAIDSMSETVQSRLFERNRAWAGAKIREDPEFFSRLARQQAPQYLWIGCSDARVPANEIVGLAPGEMFVHRNIANLVHNIDINLMSVLEFAVGVLKVQHVIVCGHYGCGGVRAAMERTEIGLIDNWLRKIKDVYIANAEYLEAEPDASKRLDLLCEINVRQQVLNICHTSIVQTAWHDRQPLSVHGWIYSIEDGLLKDLGFRIDGSHSLEPIYRMRPPQGEPSF